MFEEIDDLLKARHPETNDEDAIGFIVDYLIKKERMWLQNYIENLNRKIGVVPEGSGADINLQQRKAEAQTQLDKLQNS